MKQQTLTQKRESEKYPHNQCIARWGKALENFHVNLIVLKEIKFLTAL